MRPRGPVSAVLALALLAPAVQAGGGADVSGILRLAGQGSVGHGCPVGPELAYTNAHVVSGSDGLSWSASSGEGVAMKGEVDRFRDLATLHPRGRFTRWYPIAKAAPKKGERLRFLGYDWRSAKDAFAERVFDVRVLREFPGHLAYSPGGAPGSSGSCVLNEAGEVVAINSGSLGVGEDEKEVVGTAVALWGRWGGIEQ